MKWLRLHSLPLTWCTILLLVTQLTTYPDTTHASHPTVTSDVVSKVAAVSSAADVVCKESAIPTAAIAELCAKIAELPTVSGDSVGPTDQTCASDRCESSDDKYHRPLERDSTHDGLPFRLNRGDDVCKKINDFCKSNEPPSNKHGAKTTNPYCLKQTVSNILQSEDMLSFVRRNSQVTPELYFLCNREDYVNTFLDLGLMHLANLTYAGAPDGRAENLTALLKGATIRREDDKLLINYRKEARWSYLKSWTASEKIGHFTDALLLLPDNLHCIDRLVVAFTELKHSSAARLRAMLLHYAVVRGLVQHPAQRPLSTVIRSLRAKPIWYPVKNESLQVNDFVPWMKFISVLENPDNVATIKREVLALDSSDFGSVGNIQSEGIHDKGNWHEIDLIRQSDWVPGVSARFPGTIDILEEAAQLATGEQKGFINARVSSIEPGTHISPHCGVTNAKLRAHLALHTLPGPGFSALRVDQALLQWQHGKVILFDDSFEHEVWWQYDDQGTEIARSGTSRRLVLIVDIFHPDLSDSQRTKFRNQMKGMHIDPLQGDQQLHSNFST